MPSSGRVLCESGIYHTMLRGNERKDIFLYDKDKLHFVEGIFQKKKEIDFSIHVYCIMSNHVHLLLNTHSNNFSKIMRGIGVRYATFYNQKYERVSHVFQDRFKSEPIKNEQQLLTVLRYIHNNPVKAHLVDHPMDYQWSSFRAYVGKNPVFSIENIDPILKMFSTDKNKPLEKFQKFSEIQNELEYKNILEIKEITSLQDRKTYFHQYLSKHWPGQKLEDILLVLQREIITDLHQHTDLSIRKIARLLNLDFNFTRKLVSNFEKNESKEPSFDSKILKELSYAKSTKNA